MSLLVVTVGNRIQAVSLNDPSPGYAERYAAAIARYLPPAVEMRWSEVDISRISEYGPNNIAEMLASDELLTDLPQEWTLAYREGSTA